jgi:hypothetical protein
MIHENRKTGTVTFTFPAGSATLDFVEGEIIAAHYHGKTGQEAFYQIVMEQEGAFIFTNITPGTGARPQPIGGFMGILMEGLRLLDEKRSVTV